MRDLGERSCVIGRRYLPTLGACKVPTKDNPGDNCNGERGKPVSITVPGASFEKSRIVASPGGLTLTSYMKPEADELVFGDLTSAGLRPDYLSLWQSPKGEWCVFQTKDSTASPWRTDPCKELRKGQLSISFRSLGANGAVNPGEVVVEGEITASYNRTQDDPISLGVGKSVRSDCNGVHAAETTKSATPDNH